MPCPHGYPKASNCLDCMEEGNFDSPPLWQKVGNPFLAKFTSTCKSCGDEMNEGVDHIRRWDRADQTQYLHIGCTPLT